MWMKNGVDHGLLATLFSENGVKLKKKTTTVKPA